MNPGRAVRSHDTPVPGHLCGGLMGGGGGQVVGRQWQEKRLPPPAGTSGAAEVHREGIRF